MNCSSDSCLFYEPLAPLERMDAYVRLFMDLSLWEPFVRAVCKANSLSCHKVRPGLAGTFPTFIIDDLWVIKFFGRIFRGGQTFEVEREAARLTSPAVGIPTAKLLASGNLFSKDAEWPWPYLIFKFIPGESFGEVSDRVSQVQRVKIAAEMGEIMRRLHQIPLVNSPVFQSNWSAYIDFLQVQKQSCMARHREWGRMPDHLIDQIDSYLLPLDLWIRGDEQPHLIHADLTRDHLLGELINDQWITNGLIDFGDAMVADLSYELSALHLDLFDCSKAMLKEFMVVYGGIQQDDRFIKKAMSAALLHQFDVIGPLFERFPLLNDIMTLENLACWLWDVNACQ
jgi:hygromycin-B 7''-O-kinase